MAHSNSIGHASSYSDRSAYSFSNGYTHLHSNSRTGFYSNGCASACSDLFSFLGPNCNARSRAPLCSNGSSHTRSDHIAGFYPYLDHDCACPSFELYRPGLG